MEHFEYLVRKYMHLIAIIQAELLKCGIEIADHSAYKATIGANIEAYCVKKGIEKDDFHDHLKLLTEIAHKSTKNSMACNILLINMINGIIECYQEIVSK